MPSWAEDKFAEIEALIPNSSMLSKAAVKRAIRETIEKCAEVAETAPSADYVAEAIRKLGEP